MSTAKSLLVELFAEELPPKALKRLGESFAQTLAASLKAQGLAGEHAVVTAFATPRRLAAHVSAVQAQAPERMVTHKLMPASVALDAAGQATPALLKKLAAVGADASVVDRLERRPDGKAEALFWTTSVRGAHLAAGLQVALDAALAALPIPKVMSYQLADGWTSVHFVRPVHGLVALHGAELVPVSALGLAAGRTTQGHRFEARMDPVMLQDADHYAQQLETQGAVMASFAHRRSEIARQLQHAAAQEGLTPIADEALLDEVTALVERPNVLLCRFEREFLAVPPECLILTMKANQKYFPLLDAGGKLTEKFLVVSNIRPDDASAVIQGNERVVRPRLADAKFFFDQDRKKTLESRLPLLDRVVYHGKLGSQGARVERVRAIARAIGEQLGGATLAAQANRAAQLAKADLVTDMVGEFPELQGVMGGYYARHDGESEAVAFAIEDHYRPRFAGDALARNDVGIAVALADKLETLVGLFGVGERPSGDKDPFALRRHALGVIRMLVERELPLNLDALLALALPPFGSRIADPRAALADFCYERLAGSLRDQGYSAHEVDAVLSLRPARLAEVPKRLAAVRAFAALADAAALAAANKRIANILKKSDAAPAMVVDPARLIEPAERALAGALKTVKPIADALFDNGEYAANLRELAVLKLPVDAFFDSVMVNADDAGLRANRLALLASLHAAMNRVADLSKLAS
ncbi:MAG: glycine--tRNA ligase subunit beta [Burkholderiaceae bacterium]|nr:glycine--tRNA ligase subunit beta [Burkholderiaceae bacterium]